MSLLRKMCCRRLILPLLLLAWRPAVEAQNVRRGKARSLAGTWAGTIPSPSGRIPIALTIKAPDNAADSVRFIDLQNSIERTGSIDVLRDSAVVTLMESGVRFVIRWDRARDLLTAVLGADSISLTRVRRVQTPSIRPPYRAVEVSAMSVSHDVRIDGTLVLPEGQPTRAAALLLASPSARDRDASELLHFPLAVIADALARAGIATYRYAVSPVSADANVPTDAARSARAVSAASLAMHTLRLRPELDHRTVGVVGFGDGGRVASWLVAHEQTVDFVALLASPLLPIDSLFAIDLRNEARRRGVGVDDPPLNATIRLAQRLIALLRSPLDSSTLVHASDSLFAAAELAAPEDDRQAQRQLTAMMRAQFLEPALREFLTMNPTQVLRDAHIPVLALFGDADPSAGCVENINALHPQSAQKDDGRIEIACLPRLNRRLQAIGSDDIDSSLRSEVTVAPSVLTRLIDWLMVRLRTTP